MVLYLKKKKRKGYVHEFQLLLLSAFDDFNETENDF